ncbi:MAG: hypothetical protein SFW35_10010 [Chitinophagales bacterium]|nr:hypothetical protein [Chitinophagales bacterium]
MKKITTLKMAAASLMLFGVLTFSSCESDPCKDVTCVNGTATEDGEDCNCVCETGYEGTQCDELVRAKYLGNYNGSESCTSGTDVYAVSVTAGTTDLDVQISNIYDAGFFTNATVNADGNLTIASQSFGTGTISGSGSINGNTVTITYTITAGGVADQCTYTGTK